MSTSAGGSGCPLSDVVERAKADIELWGRTPCVEIEVVTGMTVAEDAYRRAPETVAELVTEVERLRPRVIETVEELDALPTLSIVRDEWTSAAGWQHSGIWERRGMEWHCIAAPVIPPGHPRPNLPARVLYTPEADK